jgi:ketosteroid isomerase-like protein
VSKLTNTDRVLAMYAAFGRGDVRVILEGLAPDVTWTVPGPISIPIYGTRTGRAQVAEFFKALSENLAFEEFSPREFIAQGERVIVFGYERAKTLPAGRIYESEWAHVFTFKNGQVLAFREYSDTAQVLQAFFTLTSVAA